MYYPPFKTVQNTKSPPTQVQRCSMELKPSENIPTKHNSNTTSTDISSPVTMLLVKLQYTECYTCQSSTWKRTAVGSGSCCYHTVSEQTMILFLTDSSYFQNHFLCSLCRCKLPGSIFSLKAYSQFAQRTNKKIQHIILSPFMSSSAMNYFILVSQTFIIASNTKHLFHPKDLCSLYQSQFTITVHRQLILAHSLNRKKIIK